MEASRELWLELPQCDFRRVTFVGEDQIFHIPSRERGSIATTVFIAGTGDSSTGTHSSLQSEWVITNPAVVLI